MDSNEDVSPANYFYEGLPQLLPEYDSLLIQLVVLHLTVWQILYDQDKNIGRPPVELWVETLRRIPTKEDNPLEELSRQAPDDVERTDEIEDFSDDDQQQEETDHTEQETEEQSQEQGTEADPVDVDRDRSSPQFRIIDSQRIFDHPASAGFRYRRASGQQFRAGERRGPYLQRGARKTGFRK